MKKKKKKSSSKNCGAVSGWEMEREGCWLCCVWNKAEAQSCSHGCAAARPACSAWDKKGLNSAAKLLCVGVGFLPNLVQFPAFQRNGSRSPQGRSSPAFHLGNNNREIRCNVVFATCGRTRCLTVPPRNPTLRRTMAFLVHGIHPSHGTPLLTHSIPGQGNNLQHHFCCLLSWSLSCASVNMVKQILNITRR